MLTPVKGGGYVAVAPHAGGTNAWADWTQNTNLPAGWRANTHAIEPPAGRYIVLILVLGANPAAVRVNGVDIPATNPLTITSADFSGGRGVNVWVNSGTPGQIVAAFIPA